MVYSVVTTIKQYIAVTGSVSQKGEIQPIGGINEKIEGFFDVCKIKGFTPNIKAKTMDGGTLFHQCKQKIGVAISPKFEEEPPKGLKAIAFEEPYYWDIYGTCRTDTKDEAIDYYHKLKEEEKMISRMHMKLIITEQKGYK